MKPGMTAERQYVSIVMAGHKALIRHGRA